jgi:N-acetylmuramoyl-L-alanine amidase
MEAYIHMTEYNQQPYKRSRRRKKKKKRLLRTIFLVLLIAGAVAGLAYFYEVKYLPEYKLKILANAVVPDYVDKQILSFESNSRSGEKLTNYKSIVIHYVGNPGSSAQGNHDYFENPDSNVASHFVIGLNGEIIQCLPLDEKSAASNWRNGDTISIEVCHPDDTGAFNASTYASLVKLTKWLVELGNLNPKKDIIRHYDITGKECPKYYVDNPDAWEGFKQDVAD